MLARISGMIGNRGGNIIRIYNNQFFRDGPVELAKLDPVIETQNAEYVMEALETDEATGFESHLHSRTEV
ncbi:MAG: hypothetical protein OSB69_09005 [Alphaproteobacteria bacterium]|nr:hypothetical protein [Alphaproteobacteria bacterium]